MTNSSETSNAVTTPRIYVASLSDYSAGRLLGRWIDANQSAEEIHRNIAEMLAESNEMMAEEWAIHDYEGFGGLSLAEYEPIEGVAECATLIEAHGLVFAALLEHVGGISDLDLAKRYLEESYHGAFRNVEQYAEQFIEDCYGDVLSGLPDFIRYHIDYEGIARDFELGGDIFALDVEGEVHVFSNNI